MKRLLARFRSWRLERRVAKGKQTWGRQPPKEQTGSLDGLGPVRMKGKMTISARKYNAAEDRWEDLGVIAEGER